MSDPYQVNKTMNVSKAPKSHLKINLTRKTNTKIPQPVQQNEAQQPEPQKDEHKEDRERELSNLFYAVDRAIDTLKEFKEDLDLNGLVSRITSIIDKFMGFGGKPDPKNDQEDLGIFCMIDDLQKLLFSWVVIHFLLIQPYALNAKKICKILDANGLSTGMDAEKYRQCIIADPFDRYSKALAALKAFEEGVGKLYSGIDLPDLSQVKGQQKNVQEEENDQGEEKLGVKVMDQFYYYDNLRSYFSSIIDQH